MAMELDLNQILSNSQPKPTPEARYDAKVRKLRKEEKRRRDNKAMWLARKAVIKLHEDEYRVLLKQAQAQVDAEAGPLPGDELL